MSRYAHGLDRGLRAPAGAKRACRWRAVTKTPHRIVDPVHEYIACTRSYCRRRRRSSEGMLPSPVRIYCDSSVVQLRRVTNGMQTTRPMQLQTIANAHCTVCHRPHQSYQPRRYRTKLKLPTLTDQPYQLKLSHTQRGCCKPIHKLGRLTVL